MVVTTPVNENERNDIMKYRDMDTPDSIIADIRKNKFNGLMVGLIAAAALGTLLFFKGTPKTTSVPADPNLATAVRKEVAPLKTGPNEGDVLPIEVAAPEPPVVDTLQAQREQIELLRSEKNRQLLDARRKSALDPGGAPAKPFPIELAGFNGVGQAGGSSGVSATAGPRGASDANSRFADTNAGAGVSSSKAVSIDNVEYKILQGKIIEGITLPRAVSDLPGTLCALVQRDVFAERGRIKLIPWGSRMCGVYSAELRKGQERLFTVWNTLRVANADGSIFEVTLDSIGSDQLGTSGMGGVVDTHFAEIFGTSALLSIIGAGAANLGVSPNDQNNSAAQYRESVQQAAAQTAQSVLAPYVNMPPSVTVPAGSRVRIFVNRDLDFSALYQKKNKTNVLPAVADSF